MGVVDIGVAASAASPDPLKTARRAPDVLQRLQHRLRRLPGGDAQPGGDQGVGRLERPRQRQRDLEALLGGAHAQPLAVGARPPLQQPQALAPLADRQHRLTGRDGRRREGPERVRIGVQHRSPAARQQRLEQPQLGRPVGAHGPVVVQMVLGQVGEAGRGQLDPVEAPLLDSV